jgi:hypothetical protein
MQALQIDIDDWDNFLESVEVRCPISEADMLQLINASLRNYPELCCIVHALRHAEGPVRNWNVAGFELGESHIRDRSRRLDLVARVIGEAADGYEVRWPSVCLH